MARTHTYTYVVVEISKRAYDEIRAALERAGDAYRDRFDEEEGVIDMQGLAVAIRPGRRHHRRSTVRVIEK